MSELALIRLDLPGNIKYLNVPGSCIAAMLEREDEIEERDVVIYQVQLAVHELCVNIIEHAYAETGGRIEIILSICADPHQLLIETCDSGLPFDPSLVPDPDPLSERGRGLYIKRHFTNEVTYHARGGSGWRSNGQQVWYRIAEPHPQPGYNYWRLRKHL
jgi:serine/threonine-protein kinase RsbW